MADHQSGQPPGAPLAAGEAVQSSVDVGDGDRRQGPDASRGHSQHRPSMGRARTQGGQHGPVAADGHEQITNLRRAVGGHSSILARHGDLHQLGAVLGDPGPQGLQRLLNVAAGVDDDPDARQSQRRRIRARMAVRERGHAPAINFARDHRLSTWTSSGGTRRSAQRPGGGISRANCANCGTPSPLARSYPGFARHARTRGA